MEKTMPSLETLAEVRSARKRRWATIITKLRAAIEADPLVEEGMSRAARRRLLQELGTCAASLVLRGNPWSHTGD
jgi:isopentenyldiphosphate isomerase